MSVLGFGAGGGKAAAANSGPGYSEDGFYAAVDGWLDDAFPDLQSGGIVCMIDNLELIGSAKEARRAIEAVRDTLLGRAGLRWVLCGARGIMRTTAASPSLQGRVAEPQELGPIPDEALPELVAQRLAIFSAVDRPVVPVDPDGFVELYNVVGRNLRTALKFAQDAAIELKLQDKLSLRAAQRRVFLTDWLRATAEKEHDDTDLSDEAWQAFDRVIDYGGTCSLADHAEMGYEDEKAMKRQVKRLTEANLVSSTVHETDRRRKTIIVTPRGWLVNHGRR